MTMGGKMLTAREVAIRRGCTLDLIYREIWVGKYPGAQKVGKVWKIPVESVKAREEDRGNAGR